MNDSAGQRHPIQLSDLHRLIALTTDPGCKLPDVLRAAWVFARSIGEDSFTGWISSELNGYSYAKDAPNPVPDYRRLRGTAHATGPFGLVKPVVWPNGRVAESFELMPIGYPVGEIQSLLDAATTQHFRVTYRNRIEHLLFENPDQYEAFLVLDRHNYASILEGTRNRLLSILLDLRDEFGGDAESSALSAESGDVRAKLTQIIMNPVNCVIVGEQHSLALSDPEGEVFLRERLLQVGAPDEKIDELMQELDKSKGEPPTSEKEALPQRVLDYIDRNKAWMTNTIIEVIRLGTSLTVPGSGPTALT
jgi:hypothetical protein